MILDVRPVYAGRVIQLSIERVQLPNGSVAELEIVRHPGGAAIVALDDRQHVCLLRQFRHAADGWIYELPAGKLDNREPPLDCARRELREEAGREATEWQSLGSYLSSPGVLTEVLHLYLARGLTPVADNHGDFQSFHVKDPAGFGLQISNGNRKNRRQAAAAGKTAAAAPFASTAWKTVWLDHISYEVPNYKEVVAFYVALLGWKAGEDEGSQSQCEIGDVGDIIIRRGNVQPGAPPRPASIGHISFGIAGFEPDAVKAELEKRGLNAREDTGGAGDIHTANYKSYHTTTPNGADLQISNVTKATRGA